jgi:hypothetical protein
MNKKLGVGLTMAAMVAAAGLVMTATDAEAGRGDGPVIFVTSQGLYYDSIVTRDPLPPNGPFQLLEMGANGLQTEFGPGDVGYVGGRWKEDIDGDGVYHFFSCPLLGPGRESP